MYIRFSIYYFAISAIRCIGPYCINSCAILRFADCCSFAAVSATKFKINAHAVYPFLCSTVIIAMVKDIVDTKVHHGIFIESFLNHYVPNAKCFLFIGLLIINACITRQDIWPVVTAIVKGITIKHVDIIITPNGSIPTGFRIVISNTDVNFVHWFIKQLTRHTWIALVDGMQVCIT